MSNIQLFDKFSMNLSNPNKNWTSKASKNEDLYNNILSLQDLLKKLR